MKQYEECVSLKAEETEQLKLLLEEAQQELQLTKNQVSSSDYRLFKLTVSPLFSHSCHFFSTSLNSVDMFMTRVITPCSCYCGKLI